MIKVRTIQLQHLPHSKLRSFLIIFASVMAMVFISSVKAQDAGVKNRVLTTTQGKLSSPVITPNGQSVLFLDRPGGGSTTELFSIPIRGGTPTLLNPSLVTGGNIERFLLTPDGQQIVYLADQLVDNKMELFIMPVTGGVATRLNAFTDSDDVSDFAISLDGHYVIYETNFGAGDLFSLELSTGNIVNLTSGLPSAFPRISDFKVDPTSRRVIFITFSAGFSRNAIFSVDLDGQNRVRLSVDTSDDTAIFSEFLVTGDGGHVVYAIADRFTGQAIELFSVPVDGGLASKSLTPRVTRDQSYRRLRLTPDNAFVILLSNLLSENGSVELLKVPVFTNQPIERLNQVFDNNFSSVNYLEVSPDGRFVVYIADSQVPFQESLFQVSVDGGTPIQLNQPGTGHEVAFNFAVSPDSQWVVYVEEVDKTTDQLQLFAAPMTGGEILTLSEPISDEDENDFEFVFSNDSQKIISLSPNLDQLFLSEITLEQSLCVVIPTQNEKVVSFCL
ncbi:hypothetical protein [Arenicella xantha]|uniref:WD40 repeat protein n=1 Tax=Arenicella xantha TaxID=644221 RepID=A0A395JKT4_9GAMM|nr:hypothetical protein [Arenicella xantha]RBP51189.1 hypothetical protein DFR28_102608 [Arenicella xantha]